jgi:hypothetical protein
MASHSSDLQDCDLSGGGEISGSIFRYQFSSDPSLEAGYDPAACDHIFASMQWQETVTGDWSETTVRKLCPW